MNKLNSASSGIVSSYGVPGFYGTAIGRSSLFPAFCCWEGLVRVITSGPWIAFSFWILTSRKRFPCPLSTHCISWTDNFQRSYDFLYDCLLYANDGSKRLRHRCDWLSCLVNKSCNCQKWSLYVEPSPPLLPVGAIFGPWKYFLAQKPPSAADLEGNILVFCSSLLNPVSSILSFRYELLKNFLEE